MTDDRQMRAAVVMMARMTDYMRRNPGATLKDAGAAILKRDRELAEIATSKTDVGRAVREKMAADVWEKVNGKR